MSSNTLFINWTPYLVAVNLNGKNVASINPARQQDSYFPYQETVERDTSTSNKPGVWGMSNSMALTMDGQATIYNDLNDPSGAAPNVDLLVWIFPDFLVLSQLGKQLGNRIVPSSRDPTPADPNTPNNTIPRSRDMATAYFINGTPTTVKILLNGGDQQNLDPISVDASGKAVKGPAWGASISAFTNPNVFGANGKQNQLVVRSEQSPGFNTYIIESSFASVLNLYFFIFEDTIVGEDQTGASGQIKITRISGETIESLAQAGERLLASGSSGKGR